MMLPALTGIPRSIIDNIVRCNHSSMQELFGALQELLVMIVNIVRSMSGHIERRAHVKECSVPCKNYWATSYQIVEYDACT
jgi:hypothetical protein